jgi:hypothetical protein
MVVKHTPLFKSAFRCWKSGFIYCSWGRSQEALILDFANAYNELITEHIQCRHGERLRRLTDGHGFAEKLLLEQVWWPAFRNFDNLHPEYEISDFRDGSRFLDFAFLRSSIRLAIEIDGYGPHL